MHGKCQVETITCRIQTYTLKRAALAAKKRDRQMRIQVRWHDMFDSSSIQSSVNNSRLTYTAFYNYFPSIYNFCSCFPLNRRNAAADRNADAQKSQIYLVANTLRSKIFDMSVMRNDKISISSVHINFEKHSNKCACRVRQQMRVKE